eukprot:4575089-Ditylum_brightwellii.AAC.1
MPCVDDYVPPKGQRSCSAKLRRDCVTMISSSSFLQLSSFSNYGSHRPKLTITQRDYAVFCAPILVVEDW